MNIETILLPDEQILCESTATPKKGSKSILGLILMIAFGLIPFLALWEVNFIYINIIIICAVALLFLGIAMYGLVYNLFLKDKKIIGQQYFITNKRAIVYSTKKNEFKIGYLDRFDEFRVDNEKNNFGDVYMGIVAEQSGGAKEDLSTIKDYLFNPNKKNMPVIVFESVENPYQIMKIAREQRMNLVADRPILNLVEEEGHEETKIGGQKVILYNQPIWVWLLYSGVLIFLLSIPIINIFNSLKVWNTYTKTTAIITNIETKNVANDDGYDIKYFVNVTYTINSNEYEGIISNDKCYLKSIESFKGSTTHCPKYDSRFKSMKKNNEVSIYVNPSKLTDLEYVPTLLANSSLILLLFGAIASLPILAKIKTIIKRLIKN